MTDFRNLPEPVIERLAGLQFDGPPGAFNGVDIRQRGDIREARATRFGPRLELRRDDEGRATISGYASVYGQPYEVAGGAPYGWTEIMAPGAATRSVKHRDDVFLLMDHTGWPLASTLNDGVTLSSDERGLRVDATLNVLRSDVNDFALMIEDQTVDAMSFAFQVTEGGQEWNDDYTVRTISEVRLFDVSVVKWPANPATVVIARDNKPPADPGMGLVMAQAIASRL